jgi:tetratricopeptide (TPR) repeat protein
MKRKTRLLLTVTLVLVILCGTTLYVSCTPKTAEGFVKRGYAYEEKSELDMAIADYTEAIRLDTKYSEAYYRRAHVYSDKGNKDNAINDFTTVIRLDPNNANAYYFRAGIYGEIGNFNRAIADYEACLQISPENKSVEEKLKEIKHLRNKANLNHAIARYTEAIRLNPKNADAYFRRGYAYAFIHVIPENTNVKPLNSLQEQIISMFSSQTEDWNRAISDWEAAVRINPNHADARKYLENARQLRGY